MAFYINEFGGECIVDEAAIDQAKRRGVFQLWTKSPHKYLGTGPSNKVLVQVNSNGMGDHIHEMPSLWQKVQDGFDVTVYANPFYAKCFTSIGCSFIPEREDSIGLYEVFEPQFGIMYSRRHWCNDDEVKTSDGIPIESRIQQFANYIEGKVPDSFSWRKFLLKGIKPDPRGILLGLTASSSYRSYPFGEEIKKMLSKKGLSYFEMLGGVNGALGNVQNFNQIIALVEGAQVVIGVDSGILNLAAALNKPYIALMGPTSEDTILKQFDAFNGKNNNTKRRARRVQTSV